MTFFIFIFLSMVLSSLYGMEENQYSASWQQILSLNEDQRKNSSLKMQNLGGFWKPCYDSNKKIIIASTEEKDPQSMYLPIEELLKPDRGMSNEHFNIFKYLLEGVKEDFQTNFGDYTFLPDDAVERHKAIDRYACDFNKQLEEMICRKIYKLEKNQQDVGVFTQIRINGNNKNYFNENQIVYIENENKPVGCLRVVYYLDKQKQNNFVHVALAVVFKEFRQQGYFGRLVEVLKKLIAQKSTEENILFQHLQFTTKHEYIKNMLKAYKESTIESKIDTNGNEKFECRVSLEKNIKPTLKEMI